MIRRLEAMTASGMEGLVLGDELRVKVTTPPVDAAANEALIKLLAQQSHCPRNRVDIVRGHTSRHEVIKLYGLTPKAVLTSLAVPTSS